jgi:hypothetical protein
MPSSYARSQRFKIVLQQFEVEFLVAGITPAIAVDAADQNLAVTVNLHAANPGDELGSVGRAANRDCRRAQSHQRDARWRDDADLCAIQLHQRKARSAHHVGPKTGGDCLWKSFSGDYADQGLTSCGAVQL